MMVASDSKRHPASYRDPCGFVFRHSGIIYRAVLPAGLEGYELLMQSGLYAQLHQQGRIIGHEALSGNELMPGAPQILKPQQLPFWSYPYEWSFHQLQVAALHTLGLVRSGLEFGLMLKDANANNIQFLGSRPILIDSLSFERYEDGKPWLAFRQFCEHFLYPLLLFQRFPELSPAFLMAYPDGISARLTASMLPWKCRLSWNHQLYVFLAAALSKKTGTSQKVIRISKGKILQNVAQLEGFIKSLKPRSQKAVWSNYYQESILSAGYLESKRQAVEQILSELKPERVVDAGCNTGNFSFLASEYAQEVIAFDADAASVDLLFQELRLSKSERIQVLVAGLTNPTPALGWALAERSSLPERLQGNLVLALALIHHLAIGSNVPLPYLPELFFGMTQQWLLIEFVPKQDPKTQLLLQAREDIFPDYNLEAFEAAFAKHFQIEKKMLLPHSERVLYLMKRY
ncbi:MAG: class I SAM-dependent methyltransferase [Bacteroidetes bacterium]|nr:class I SAM-dependent methyltransferase [Bacteroidota bacterium]MBS1628615.1 class I SAM-dependent methyltransferase [Bacteroidota bacterium]